MPLTSKGMKILRSMKEHYGDEKGTQVFYASRNKGTITGVDPETSSLVMEIDDGTRLTLEAGSYVWRPGTNHVVHRLGLFKVEAFHGSPRIIKHRRELHNARMHRALGHYAHGALGHLANPKHPPHVYAQKALEVHGRILKHRKFPAFNQGALNKLKSIANNEEHAATVSPTIRSSKPALPDKPPAPAAPDALQMPPPPPAPLAPPKQPTAPQTNNTTVVSAPPAKTV